MVSRENKTAVAIHALAKKYGVTYTETANDIFGHHVTRLSGDDVKLDHTELLLIALQRAGHLSRTDSVRLNAEYLREAML